MLKLFDTLPVNVKEEPSISVIDLSVPESGLEKVAANSEITEFISTLKPKEGFTYLHINAMTAGEYHGANRNADFFPEENLRMYHKTFQTSPAHVFRSHINKDPSRAYGKVIFSVYNDNMHRVELIAECPNDLVDDLNSRIKAGDYPTTSMACKTPFDTCSICGNRAKSRQEYCSHLSTQLGKLYPDGKKVYAINDAPLHFFDISIVVRPADVNSSILQKVAYAGTIGSAESAELEGLSENQFHEKTSELKKWSELVKEISDGYVLNSETDPGNLLSKTQDLPIGTIEHLHSFELPEVFTAMADYGISPSIGYLAELIARKYLGEGYFGIGDIVEAYLKTIENNQVVPVQRYTEPSHVNPIIHSALAPYAAGSSLLPDAIEKRASGIGYAGNGPHIEPLPWEENIQEQDVQAVQTLSRNYGKVLLGLGVAALLAKYFITHQIEKKINTDRNDNFKNNVKIVIIKKSSDYSVAANLSRASLQKSIPNNGSNEDSSGGSSNLVVANSLAKRVLGRSRSAVGKKLSGILKLVGLGLKVTDTN
jgi:hypothetical protein